MKRYGNIYSKIYDIENLKLAHKMARKDKTFYRDVKTIDEDIKRKEAGEDNEDYLLQIQEILKNHTYKVSDYSISTINDKGKERILMKLPYFPDRIIQWAILLQIESIFMETFCYHSCASIKGRGIKRASKLIKKYMREDPEGTKYCLKIDIHHFYPSVDHQILKQLIRKKIKDKELLELLDLIIDSPMEQEIDLEHYKKGCGIPIGSYLSQFLGNYYLTYFDHWLKEEKHIKYTVRYMDDIIIFSSNKEELHLLLEEIREFLDINLKLKIKDNYQIFPTYERGVDFVGYRFFGTHILLRKTTYKRFKRIMLYIKKIEKINYSLYCSFNSYRGLLKWCSSFNLEEKYIIPLNHIIDFYYIKNIANYDFYKAKTYLRKRYI